jgi:hypothetical protein
MIYLCEREIGFDAAEIGFPSILGCRAIVLVTSGGLFGYHLNGNLNVNKKNVLLNFINTHPQGTPRGALYAASTGAGLRQDHDELKELASNLHYTGAIYWANLTSLGAGSIYAHYVGINHATCGITGRTWDDATDSIPGNKGAYVAGANRAIANGVANTQMYTNLDQTGLRAVYPTKL